MRLACLENEITKGKKQISNKYQIKINIGLLITGKSILILNTLRKMFQRVFYYRK